MEGMTLFWGGVRTELISPHVLVNNAAASNSTQALTEVAQEHLEHEFSVNVFGTIYMTQAVVGTGKMPKGGRIINIGSIASKLSSPGPSVYSAAKSAQDSLTASWAGEVSLPWRSSLAQYKALF